MTKQRLVAPSREKRSQSAGTKSNLDARHDRTFKRLSALVPKEQWKEVLGYFPENAKAAKLLMLLGDPVNNRLTLGKLSVQSGLSTAELTLFFNNSRKQEGIVRMSQKLPDIMEETAEDALSSLAPCERCGGEGQRKDKPCKRGSSHPNCIIDISAPSYSRHYRYELPSLVTRLWAHSSHRGRSTFETLIL